MSNLISDALLIEDDCLGLETHMSDGDVEVSIERLGKKLKKIFVKDPTSNDADVKELKSILEKVKKSTTGEVTISGQDNLRWLVYSGSSYPDGYNHVEKTLGHLIKLSKAAAEVADLSLSAMDVVYDIYEGRLDDNLTASDFFKNQQSTDFKKYANSYDGPVFGNVGFTWEQINAAFIIKKKVDKDLVIDTDKIKITLSKDEVIKLIETGIGILETFIKLYDKVKKLAKDNSEMLVKLAMYRGIPQSVNNKSNSEELTLIAFSGLPLAKNLYKPMEWVDELFNHFVDVLMMFGRKF